MSSREGAHGHKPIAKPYVAFRALICNGDALTLHLRERALIRKAQQTLVNEP